MTSSRRPLTSTNRCPRSVCGTVAGASVCSFTSALHDSSWSHFEAVRDTPALRRLREQVMRMGQGAILDNYDRERAFWEGVVPQVSRACMRDALGPLFDRALADPSITAWVCDNDQCADLALDHLAFLRVPVPRRLSVVGFDDSDLAIRRGITSYNFGSLDAMTALLNAIAGPAPRKPGTWREVRVAGYVRGRDTVRNAG